jgi:hypothetical protein
MLLHRHVGTATFQIPYKFVMHRPPHAGDVRPWLATLLTQLSMR